MERADRTSLDWASSAEVHIDPAAGGGRRAALESALRAAVRDGRLRPGDRVPSTRALAHDLGLARGTVAEAYAQLAAEGYLQTRPGAPTRIAADVQTVAAVPPADDVQAAGPARFDLRAGIPDLGAFPRPAWLAASRRALAAAPDASLSVVDPRGLFELRQALAGHVGRTRGVLADPGLIVVCSGFSQALAVICHALRADGMRQVAMEDPCLAAHRAIAAGSGLRVTPLAVDEGGALPEMAAGAGAALVTPAHQFPLGATLAPARRAAFVKWARTHGTVVIEDDYDGEFRYDRQPVGALQGLDPEHVIYAGTASKTLAPGVRLGWLVLPPRLVPAAAAAAEILGAATSALQQLALAEFVRCGAHDRHVRRMRHRYRRRRDQLLGVLAERAPGLRTRGVAAGLHVVVELPPGGATEAEVVARAEPRSLALETLGSYWHRPGAAMQGLVVGYAAPPEHAYAQTLDVLADVLAPLGRK